jgi:hypothetical protein
MHKDLDGHPDELATKIFREYEKRKRREMRPICTPKTVKTERHLVIPLYQKAGKR